MHIGRRMVKEFYDMEIMLDLEELINPKHTALVVVDVMNDECRKRDEEGIVSYINKEFEVLVPRLKSLIEVARKAKVQLCYLQHTTLPNMINESPPRIRYLMKARGSNDPDVVTMFDLEGTWGHKIVEDIEPEPSDFLIKKHRPSGFVGTNMDLLLKNAGIQTLVFTGIVTEGCVEATVRSAVHHDYYIVVVRDGVASRDPEAHNASLRWYGKHFDRPTIKQLSELWIS